MEQSKLPIKRRSNFSLLKQLQHQMSRLWRQLPTRSSASPRPVHAREHSIGWKVDGAQFWQLGQSSPQHRILRHFFKELKHRS